MTAEVKQMHQPDIKMMRDHLDLLFAPAIDDGLKFQIQIDAGIPGGTWTSQNFEGSELGIEEACVFAERMNAEVQRNIYVGVNPRRPDLPVAQAAKDKDILCAYWQFADIDSPDTVAQLREEQKSGTFPIAPNVIVMTGRTPEARPHFYWRLAEAAGNLKAWTENQKNIAARLGGDAVIDPRRIMRLSGSINYPGQKKIERGYRIELVTHAEPDDDRPPVPFEQFLVSFPKAARSASQGAAERPGRLQIGSDRITPSVLIARALEDDGQWHYSVRDLVAHWTNLNWSDAEIMLQAAGLTTPGYSVDQTRQELRSFIDSARSKWNLRDAEADVADALEEADATFPVMTIAEIENQPPPTYFIQDVVTDFGITLLYGDPGAGKTFLALDIASHIATGCDWNGHETKKGSVVYIVAEGGRGIGKRIKGWRQHHGIAAQDIDLLLIPEAVQILQDGQADKLARSITAHLSDGLGLLVVDTLSRSIAGIDENSADTMSSFLLSLDGIQKQLKCAVMVIHHSGKSKESGPRGSSAIAGGFDTVIHLKGKSGEQWSTMKVEKQKDDEEIPEKLFLKEQISLRHDGTGIEQGTTLILKERNSDEKKNDNDLTRDQIREIFGLITLGWVEDNPWSHSPQAKSRGRWLPLRISKTYGIDLESAKWWVASWMDNGVIKSERGRVQGQQIRGLVVNEEI